MVTVVFAFTIGQWARAPASGLATPKAETAATKTIETATASTTILPWVPRLALISEWFSIVPYERRSADHVPEHSPEPAIQVPPPSVADMRPVPVALWLPRDTVTVTAPLLPTAPEMLNAAVPA